MSGPRPGVDVHNSSVSSSVKHLVPTQPRGETSLIRTSVMISLLGAAVVLTASARSQSPPSGVPLSRRWVLGIGVDPAPVPKPVLLRKSAVQAELKLTRAQRE